MPRRGVRLLAGAETLDGLVRRNAGLGAEHLDRRGVEVVINSWLAAAAATGRQSGEQGQGRDDLDHGWFSIDYSYAASLYTELSSGNA